MKKYKTLATAIREEHLSSKENYTLTYNTSLYGELTLTKTQLRAIVQSECLESDEFTEQFSLLLAAWHALPVELSPKDKQAYDTISSLIGKLRTSSNIKQMIEITFGLCWTLVKTKCGLLYGDWPNEEEPVERLMGVIAHTNSNAIPELIALDCYLPVDSLTYHITESMIPMARKLIDPKSLPDNQTPDDIADKLTANFPNLLEIIGGVEIRKSAISAILAVIPTLNCEAAQWLMNCKTQPEGDVTYLDKYIKTRINLSLSLTNTASDSELQETNNMLDALTKYAPLDGAHMCCYTLYFGRSFMPNTSRECYYPKIYRLVKTALTIKDSAKFAQLIKDMEQAKVRIDLVEAAPVVEERKSNMVLTHALPSFDNKSNPEVAVEGLMLFIHGLLHMLSGDVEPVETLCAEARLPNVFEMLVNNNACKIDTQSIVGITYQHLDLYSTVGRVAARLTALTDYCEQAIQVATETSHINLLEVENVLLDLRIAGKPDLVVYRPL